MAAASSPEDPDSEQLSNEVIGAMVLAAGHLIRPAALQFVHATGHLSWSNVGVTRDVHAYVAKVKVLAALAQPKPCADVRSWAGSGFRTLAPSTVVFDAAFMPNWVAVGDLPAGLASYETPAERPLLARTSHLKDELTDLEAREVETWGRIMDALVLSP